MKVIKPLSLGLLQKPYRYAGQDRVVIVALGFFRLGADNREFLPEPAQWPEMLKRLPAEQPLDMVMPKPHGEVLAAASAFSPEPVTHMDVRLQVGSIDKRLKVIGERGWRYGTVPLHQIDAPAPFTHMPLTWERAYGGENHPQNPVGRGHTGSRFSAFVGVNEGAMPNIEYPDRAITGHHQALEPAGYAPTDVRWAPRKDRGGTYDADWLKNISPGLPADIDWTIFNAAPADQQIKDYWQGGEAYRLEGLHPTRPVISGRLPELRVRAFARIADDTREVPLRCDTVWLFPDAELGLLLYRGETPVADLDGDDLDTILLAYENLADRPRPADHYREALTVRLGGREALAHIANEAPLKPQPDAAAQARRAGEQAEAEAQWLAETQTMLDAGHAESGLEGPAPKAALPPLGVLPAAALARGEADIARVLVKADAAIAQARAEGEQKLAEMRESLAKLETPAAQGGTEDAIARAHGIPQRERADALLQSLGPDASAEQRQHIETLAGNALEAQGRRAAFDPVPPALSPEAAQALGAEVRRLLAAGVSLAGRDLAGAQLAGIDLAGADLTGTLLERADLTGANLAGAKLRGAVLTAANLSRARLDGADLDQAGCNRADFSGASLRGVTGARVLAFAARFTGADFSQAHLATLIAHEADFSGACLDDARLPGALLLDIRAAGSRWHRAVLDKAVMYRADLARADLAGAVLNNAILAEARAATSSWQGAAFEQCFFIASDFTAANLREVRAEGSGWRQGTLVGADLSGGRFARCDFSRADLSRALLQGAKLPGAILQRTRFMGARVQGADFFQAQARMADFIHADVRDARFKHCDLTQAVFEKAQGRAA